MEIEREGNIFFNLIKNETSLTEVFCNFMKYEIFRNLFIDLINEKIKKEENKIDKSIVEFQNFDTEVPLNDEQKNGRIDLQLKINNDIYLFEIKIETFTSLTNNQPNNYLKYLKNKNENLFFILPKGYFHKNEIFNRWCHLETENKYTKEDIENHNIIYWEDILKQIRKQELNKVDIFINEFCKILDYKWFYFEKIIFTENELNLIFRDEKEEGYKMLENTNVPVLMKKLFQIVVDTKVDYYKKDKDNVEQRYDYFGYYLENKKYEIIDNITIWFGIDYELWEIEKHPIIIQIETNKQEESLNLENFLKNKIDYTKFTYENGYIIFYIPLEKEIFKNEEETITQKLTQKIEKVIDLLKEYNKE